jgi:hypothetical protein
VIKMKRQYPIILKLLFEQSKATNSSETYSYQ